MRNYCGGILTQTMPMSIQLVDNFGSYGAQNLYCRWIARVPDAAQSIMVNFTRYSYLPGDQFILQTLYEDGRSYYDTIQPKLYTLDANGVSDVTVHYLSSTKQAEQPFLIVITASDQSYNSFVGLFVSLGVIVLICIICSIFFYRCSKMIIENNRRLQERRALELAAINSAFGVEVNREEEIKQQNKQLLDGLFQNELKPIKYNKRINEFKAPNCTVCLEVFNSNNEIVKLNCKHLFHFHCLKDWLDKILLEPKCPVCNDHILPKVEEAPSNNIIVNNVNQNANENSRRDLLVLDRNNYVYVNNQNNNNTIQSITMNNQGNERSGNNRSEYGGVIQNNNYIEEDANPINNNVNQRSNIRINNQPQSYQNQPITDRQNYQFNISNIDSVPTSNRPVNNSLLFRPINRNNFIQ
jgi:hypothetical protein